jgi:hypothetical protein
MRVDVHPELDQREEEAVTLAVKDIIDINGSKVYFNCVALKIKSKGACSSKYLHVHCENYDPPLSGLASLVIWMRVYGINTEVNGEDYGVAMLQKALRMVKKKTRRKDIISKEQMDVEIAAEAAKEAAEAYRKLDI